MFFIFSFVTIFLKIAISGPWLWLVVLLKEIKKQWEPFRSFLRYTALPSKQWLNTIEVKTLSWLGFLMLDETLWPKPSRDQRVCFHVLGSQAGTDAEDTEEQQVSKACSSGLTQQPVSLYNSGAPARGWPCMLCPPTSVSQENALQASVKVLLSR